MSIVRPAVIFEDREEAGRRLAKPLQRFRDTDNLVLAIPRGGVPVAAAAAHRLLMPWNVLVSRKLPTPWNPSAGFGAVTADGSVVLNEGMLHGLRLAQHQIDEIVSQVRAEAERQAKAYASERAPDRVDGRRVILVDDALISGYTMLAATKSARASGASEVIVAAPIASRYAAGLVETAADRCVFEVVSPSVPFDVSDFYIQRPVLTDDDITPLLRGA